MVVNLSPEQIAKTLAAYHQRNAQRIQENLQVDQERQKIKDHYAKMPYGTCKKLSQDKHCANCHTIMLEGSRNVKTRTRLGSDRGHNPRWITLYFCGDCIK